MLPARLQTPRKQSQRLAGEHIGTSHSFSQAFFTAVATMATAATYRVIEK